MNISSKQFVIIIIILAIASGIIWGMPFDRPIRSDAGTFLEVASFIMEKGPLRNDDLMDHAADRLFYPMFLAGVFKIFGPHKVVVKLIQVLFFALLAVLVYELLRILFDERLARLAGFMVAMCYCIAAFTSWLYREVFFATLIFLLIYLLYQAQLKKKNIWFIAAGAVFAMATLTNAIIQFFLIFIIANFLFLNRKGKIKEILPKIALFILTFVLVLSPFIINNYVSFGRVPFPFGSRYGLVAGMRMEKMKAIEGKYFQHLIANTTGDFFAQRLFSDYNRDEARLGWNVQREWYERDYQVVDRAQVDRNLTKTAIIETFKHPILFLQMTSIDFLKFNTPLVPDVRMQHMFAEPDSHPEFSGFTKGIIILTIRFIYLIAAILIIYAIVKNIKKWDKINWIVLIVLYFNAIFSLLHARARSSVPMYPYYIILLAIGILIVWDKIVLKNN